VALEEASVTVLLEADRVIHSYGSRTVLGGVSLAVHASEVVALVGPNGAGKTTLLKTLAGLLVPRAGRVVRRTADRAGVAYLAQSEELPLDWTVREVVELGRLPHVGLWRALSKRDEDAIETAMERTRVAPLAHRVLATLSGGERRRAALARALAQEPSVLLLDEPTTHLDLRHQIELFSTLRAEAARGVGVVAVMHDLGFAARADRCVLMADGTIRADGAPADVLSAGALRETYGAAVEILRSSNGALAIVPAFAKEGPSWIDESS
jgi:iron complex transport system ATP-binding protein